ncbi:MAG: ATP-binding protein [Gemmatimonas sp.]
MLAAATARSRLFHPADTGSFRAPRPLGVGIAALVMLCGLTGVLGNAANWSRLAGPIAGWPAIPWLPSVELVVTGAAFLALLRADRRVTLPLAAVAALVSLLCIVGTLGAFTLPYGGMALSSALLHSTISFAILVSAASESPRDEERALGVAGFVIVTMVLTMFGATVSGLLDPVVDAVVAGSSMQTLVSMLLIGLYLLGKLWMSGRVTVENADWLPPGIGFASVLTVLVLWRALSVREDDQLAALIAQAGAAQSRAMRESMHGLARSLSRSAEWRAGGATSEQQTRDLHALQNDIRGLEGGVFISIQGGHQVLAATDAPLPGLDSVWNAHVAATHVLTDSIHYWPMDTAAARFVVVAPSCTTPTSCDGAIVVVVRTEVVFRGILSDTALGFFHRIRAATSEHASAPSRGSTLAVLPVALPLRFGDVHLELDTWPTRGTVARVRSKLPLVVLTMGGLLSVLLMLTTFLGQGARRLARSREKARLASVLERSTDGVWDWDLVSGLADHSSGLWRHLGYESDGAHSNRDRWMEVVHPEDADNFTRELTRHLNGDSEVFAFEYRVKNRNGEWHTMVDRARVVERTPAGQPIRLLGVRADVTEARKAQAARFLNERRFRAIFDSGFQFQLLLDREGQVLEVNRAALEAGNATVEHVVGQPVWTTLWWAGNDAAHEPLQRALKTARDGTAARYETEVNGEGGPSSTLEVAIKPFIDRAGETNQLLLEARDITVRRRAEAALQEVDTLTTMGRVAARVAHEINNPLAGIQNSFLLIKGAVSPTHPHFSYVGAIEREIDRIAAVTRQLYETYRPEQDSSAGTSVRSLVTDAVTFLAQVNRHTHVRIETDFSNVPSVIRLPSAMLRQIFINLAQNAFEASPPGELVSIRAELSDGNFALSVRDRGNGVPAALRERIFDPFFSTKDRGVRTGGMGLGLALVRRTVTAAGGTITIADAPDSGTIFTVTLPVPSGAQGETA